MNEKERVSYIKALMYIALADDKIEESEQIYLEEIGKIYGLSEDAFEEIKNCIIKREESLESILSGIESRQHKLSLVYDLLALCYADGHYSFIEQEGMKKVCNIMNIEGTRLQEFESVMEEQLNLQERIHALLER